MPVIEEILKTKGKELVTVSPSTTVLEATQVLAKHNIGALIIVDGGAPVGIISERDIVRAAPKGFAQLERTPVSELMTRDLIVGLPTDDIAYVMSVMTQNRIRHLPVVQGGKLVGILSIGDVVKVQLTEQTFENRILRDYIEGKYPA